MRISPFSVRTKIHLPLFDMAASRAFSFRLRVPATSHSTVAELEASQVNSTNSVTRNIANLLFMRLSPFSTKAAKRSVKPVFDLLEPQLTCSLVFCQ
jgi:hypothetical protein